MGVQTVEAKDAEKMFEGFEHLMPFRVHDILLVTSLYDSFILREDGSLNELLIGESLELDLKHVPGISHVASGREALEAALREPRFNLIVANLELGDMDAAELARRVKLAGLDIPVVVLAYDYRHVKQFVREHPHTDIDRIFLWQGNARILVAIVKYIEDKRNVLHDTEVIGVPVVLVVEDNIRYYSSFLPVIYTEVIMQSRRLLDEGINVAHKLVRMRARPKILLATNYEDAAELVLKYQRYLFGVVSDVEFPRGGEMNPDSGFDLARLVHRVTPDVPVILQSSRPAFMERAAREGFSFLQKRSVTFLNDLRQFLVGQFGFGDFIFRMPDGTEVGRATDLNQLEHLLREVPIESVEYHSERNHFSHWLMARTELGLAEKLRPRKVSDFQTSEHLRNDLANAIVNYRLEQNQLLVGDFNPASFNNGGSFFLRLGEGSLGGKARGLAFVRHLIYRHRIAHAFAGVRISVPPSLVLATGIFDQFLKDNDLHDFAIHCDDDELIQKRFIETPLPQAVQQYLRAFLERVTYPLAVRSSSLLEDSQYQPFTGVYETFMLSNQEPDIEDRLKILMEAITRVYASTFSQHAKSYIRATPYRLEEEKMAIILQQVVGTTHGTRFYPNFSGVVRSWNFYPAAPMHSNDGIAAVALGLGRAVVDGGRCLSFCPRYPRHILQFSSVEDILANSQSEFWALDLNHPAHTANSVADLREVPFSLKVAETDGTLQAVGSTYSADDHAVYDGVARAGARVVSFAPVLKHAIFPLPAILDQISTIGEAALGRPVEIEFAVRLPQAPGEVADFGFLQMRPLVLSREGEELRMEVLDSANVLCQSCKVLGNGRIADLHDIVVVDLHRFERAHSQAVAEAVGQLNAQLCARNIPYLLIGVGRWGSNDPWLGIPVDWDQISNARVIVEAGFRDFRVTPSQGSHFFQNLTAFQIGYFTVNPDADEGSIDWDWLAAQPASQEFGPVRHLRVPVPVVVVMNGRESRGVIMKPGCDVTR